MEKIDEAGKALNKDKGKSLLLEGLRIGLLSFIISYLICFVISILVKLFAMDYLQEAILGAIGSVSSGGFATIIKTTAAVLSISLLNSHGEIRIGFIVFLLIPILAFFISENKKGRKNGFSPENLIVYGASSAVFSFVCSSLQGLTAGKWIGIEVNFFSIKNIGITFFVALLIQIIIGINYNKKVEGYIRATRLLLRMSLGVGLLLGLIDLIRIVMKIPIGFLGKTGAILMLLPNFAVYKSALLMNNDIMTSDALTKSIEKFAHLQPTFEGLNLTLSIIAILVWIALVIIALLYLKRQKYWSELGLFALSFSILSCFLAFAASTSLGEVILIGEIYIGINMAMAFLIPLITIAALGVFVWIIRKMIEIIREL